ncbi:MAG: FtsX-like permease family protein, partial [Actinomycetota bacterium]
MTITEERPPARPLDDSAAASSGRERGGDSTIGAASRWRLAFRIALRESLRRPGRTTLVMLLVLVPVAAMTMGIVIARSQVVSGVDGWERRLGSADVVLVGGFPFELDPPPGVEPVTIDEVQLPVGSTVVEYDSVYSPIPDIGLGGNNSVEFTDVPLDELGAGVGYDLIDGRAPRSASEVAISREVASASGVGVGDVLDLTNPDLTLDVVGVVENIDRLSAQFMILDDIDRDLVRPGQLQVNRLVTFPADVDPVEASRELAAIGAARPSSSGPPSAAFHLESRWLDHHSWTSGGGQPEPGLLIVAWAASVVLFAALGIVIAAAFAVSARRQLVTIGQLSANGAPHRLIRRVLGLQGTVTALVAATLGLGVGILLAVLGQPIVEEVLDRRIDGLDVRPWDLVVIVVTATAAGTIAALVPARSTSRMPVLAALSGRRPVSDPPGWMAPTGVALFVGGWLVLLGVVTTDVASDSSGVFVALAGIAGGLGILFGMVCCSPIVVHLVGRLADRLRGSGRLAVRSLARTRGRSAAIVTSIATVMAIGTAALTAGASVDARDSETGTGVYASNTVHLEFQREVFDRERQTGFDPVTGQPDLAFRNEPLVDLVTPAPVPAEINEAIDAVMGDVSPLEIRSAGFVDDHLHLAVADEDLLNFLEVSAEARSAIDGGTVLTAGVWSGRDATGVSTSGERIEIDLEALETAGLRELDGALTLVERRASQLRIGALISEREAAERELVMVPIRYLYERSTPLTLDERARIHSFSPFEPVNDSAFLLPGEDPSTVDSRSAGNEQIVLDGYWSVFAPSPSE